MSIHVVFDNLKEDKERSHNYIIGEFHVKSSSRYTFESLQILNNSKNVFKNYDVTKVDIFCLKHR